jgi:hypothetical protein
MGINATCLDCQHRHAEHRGKYCRIFHEKPAVFPCGRCEPRLYRFARFKVNLKKIRRLDKRISKIDRDILKGVRS